MNVRKQKIQELMEQGYTESQAYYITDFTRRDVSKPYAPRPRRTWCPDDFEKLNITIQREKYTPYGYTVYQNGRKRTIFTAKGTVYKNGGCKYYPCFAITVEGKQRIVSLATGIWVGILRKSIPSGYVVDHIDNDSFNNDISNLQLLTIRENIEKNPARKLKNNQKEEE